MVSHQYQEVDYNSFHLIEHLLWSKLYLYNSYNQILTKLCKIGSGIIPVS